MKCSLIIDFWLLFNKRFVQKTNHAKGTFPYLEAAIKCKKGGKIKKKRGGSEEGRS